MLVTMADHSEHAEGQDLAPLPRKAAKRRRIQLLEGSSSILQPYPCTEGAAPCRLTPPPAGACCMYYAGLKTASDCCSARGTHATSLRRQPRAPAVSPACTC